MNEGRTPICIIAPTADLEKKARLVCEKYQKNIEIYHATLVDVKELVTRLSSQGTEIFIGRRGLGHYMKELVPDQTVIIDTEVGDYIPAFEAAKKTKGKVAFYRYTKVPEDIKTMCKVLGIHALYYIFKTAEECEAVVKQSIADGAEFGIGGGDSQIYAQQLGFPHFTVESTEQSVLKAIEMAEHLLELKRVEAEKQHLLKVRLERYEMVFHHTHDAILAVDDHGCVSVWNEEAQRAMRHIEKPYAGRSISEILDGIGPEEVLQNSKQEISQLVHLGGEVFSVLRIPVVVDGMVAGAVLILQNVRTLQDREKKIRLKLHEKGLVAKYRFEDIIGDSPVMKENIELARKFARSKATILIQGETGTGKELFAQSIHNGSKRADGPFVAVNCGALPKTLLEAELFGYEEGAFTGALKGGKAGLFEVAHGGTIFLDEIGEMPLETQVQLLRVLQEKEIRRIGSDRVIPVNIRIITATNRDLYQDVQDHLFREDLYYRLNVLNLVIPPLRERQMDMVKIGMDIYRGYSQKSGRKNNEFVERMLRKLQGYAWPGNVRELHNLIERIHVLLSQNEEEDTVERYIYSYLRQPQQSGHPMDGSGRDGQSVKKPTLPEEACESEQSLGDWEKKKILKLLKETNLDIDETARRLGISRSTLYRRIRKYRIELR